MDFKRFLKNTSILVFLFIFASTLSAQEITLVGHVYSGTSSNNALIPVEGAQISIALDSVPEGTMTTSNEEGYYELPFEWNWDGPIPISCQAEGYEFYYSVFIPNSNSAEFEYDILLTPISGDIITALQGHVWEGNGCLGGPMGCPIENAHIEAVPLNSPTDVVYTANSDPLGFYYMELPAGAYVATCSAEGWVTESTVLEIGSGGVIYDFYLPEEGADSEVYFSGIVWGEVGPMLPAFEPIAGAAVILYGGFTGGVLAETLTSDDGHFEFGDVVWSATAVSIHADGFVDQEFGISELCTVIDPTNTECFPLNHDFYLNLENQLDHILVHGMVTGQVSPMGPVFPIAGAMITASPIWGDDVHFETVSDENGYYELELDGLSVTAEWVLTCTAEEFGSQTAQIIIGNQMEIELNFHFTAWDEPEVPAPHDLTIDILESEPPYAALNWQYDSDSDPSGSSPVFLIYANWGWNDDTEWHLVAETTETHHQFVIGDVIDFSTCFKVTAVYNGVESEPSNVACIDDSNPEPVCEDLSPFDFGPCAMEIGIGWNGEHCTWFSGCGTVDQYSVDHADSFFNSMEECNAACTDVAENGALAGEVFYQWGDAIELVAGALIQVHSSAGFIFESETNENGFYLIEEIPAGNYAVTCTVYTEESMTQEVEIIAGTSAILDFWFGEPWYETSLMGMVYDANHENQIVNEAHIMAHSADGVIIETYSYEGFYWLSLPGAGTYYLTVSAEGYLDLNATFDVQGVMEHDFYLTPAEDIPGDINFDGEVNVLDVVALVNFVIFIEEPTDAEFAAGDLNNDGTLNILDVVLMVNMILSGDTLPEGCFIEPEVGPCDGICPTYYYNQDTGTCEEFITGCCGVEAFDTLEECEEACE